MNALRQSSRTRLTMAVSLTLAIVLAGLALGAAPSQAAGSYPDWKGEYYANKDLKGKPVLVRNDGGVDFDWGSGAPAAGLPADNFSVRWTRHVTFSAGSYRFCVRADDGVRVEIDDKTPFIREWHDGSDTFCADVTLAKGDHKVRVEYFEHAGLANVLFWWEKATWKAEYFSNRYLQGKPTAVRHEARINFDWGSGAPAGLPADNFSARWTRHIFFVGGTYRFCVQGDDGVRVEMDDKAPFINAWHDGDGTYCVDRPVTKGYHKVRVEYYEHTGQARAKFWWDKLN